MYLAICGNTGSGKSTLGRYLAAHLCGARHLEYIDEGELHHPFLQKMFDRPRDYAFLVQVNFALQRTMRIKDCADRGMPFLMERSLPEDFLFARRHFELGNMSRGQFEAYCGLWTQCEDQAAQPSGYIYLYTDDTPLLARRVVEGYKANRRKQELPDDALREYIDDLNKRYEDWFADLRVEKIRVSVLTGNLDASAEVRRTLAFIESCLSRTT